MALTRTVSELITETMRDLGLISQRQSPSEDDAKFIRGRYEDVLEELRDDDLVYWENDAIPKEVFVALVKHMGMEVGGAFGLGAPDPKTMQEMLYVTKKRIRRRLHKPNTGLPVTVENF